MILNLTQHVGTPEQGVIEPSKEDKDLIKSLLTFESLEDTYDDEMFRRAESLGEIATRYETRKVMIGGASFFMTTLEGVLMEKFAIQTLYSFSVRESQEIPDGNGGVKKTSIFKHVGWVSGVSPY